MSGVNFESIADHWFWWTMTAACVVWYSTITVYVAIKGVSDIKNMLKKLSDKQNGPQDSAGAAEQARD